MASNKTKAELLEELEALNLRIRELEEQQAGTMECGEVAESLQESEEKYRRLVEMANDAIFLADADTGLLLDCNKQAEKLIGMSADRLIGMHQTILHPQGESERYSETFHDHVENESAIIQGLYAQHRDGHLIPVEISARVFKFGGKRVIQGIFRDISERVHTEQALRGSEERYRLVSELMSDYVYSVKIDEAGSFEREWNTDPSHTIHGFSWAEVTKQGGWESLVHPEDVPLVQELRETYLSGRPSVEEFRLVTGNHEVIWIRHYGRPIYDSAQGRVVRLLGAVKDITARKMAEQHLKYRIDFERLITKLSTQFINLPIERIDVSISNALEQIGEFAGVDRSYMFRFYEKGGKMNNTHEWCREGVEPQMQRLQAQPTEFFAWSMAQLNRGEAIHIPKVEELPAEAAAEKEEFQKENIKSLVFVPMVYKGKTVGFIGFDSVRQETEWPEDIINLLKIVSDIFVNALMRKEAEQALQAEKERLSVTLKSIGDGVISTDIDGKVQLLNEVAETLTGFPQDEARGRILCDVFQLLDTKTGQLCRNIAKTVMEEGDFWTSPIKTRLIGRDGTELQIEHTITPIMDAENQPAGVVVVFRDVTAKLQMEQELLKIQKLDSIGILAGGIAHDFNNLLTGILGGISLARLKVPEDDSNFSVLAEAEKAASQAKDLTYQLLTFSRGGAPVKEAASIQELLMDAASFHLRGSRCKCRFHFDDELSAADIDKSQISQVIQNLVINAEQAMPGGGIIDIKGENVTLGAKDNLPLKPGEYVKITIEDWGVGIPDEHLPKLFDPYFSTKQKGSGLGLATVFSIVQRHEGYISAESELGNGSAFCVYLPASEEMPVSELEPETHLQSAWEKGKVLLMDDEEIVRNTAGHMLEHLGCEVEYAVGGKEAVLKFRKSVDAKKPFDLLIMDLTVPAGMGGVEAMPELVKLDPEVKVVVSSGYSTDPIVANYKAHGFAAVITKPYKIKELNEMLRRLFPKES